MIMKTLSSFAVSILLLMLSAASQGSMIVTLSKSGAPDLTATGVEHATYSDGAISRLEDVFDQGVAEHVGEWMAAHGELLGS